jgi:hypothetical protein
MTMRSLRLGAAALATVALAACNKPADKPVIDSTNPANATQSMPATPVDSTVKPDSIAPKPATDSAKPMTTTDSAKPMPAPAAPATKKP